MSLNKKNTGNKAPNAYRIMTGLGADIKASYRNQEKLFQKR